MALFITCGSMACAQGRQSLGGIAVHLSADRHRHALCRSGLKPRASELMTVGAFARLGCYVVARPGCVKAAGVLRSRGTVRPAQEVGARTREEIPGSVVVHRLHSSCNHCLTERIPVTRNCSAKPWNRPVPVGGRRPQSPGFRPTPQFTAADRPSRHGLAEQLLRQGKPWRGG